MKLTAYLEAQKESPSGFALRIGVPASTVSRIIAGTRQPRLDTIAKIEAATNGAVTANDFMPAPSKEPEAA